jgi:hypothetical protein
VQRERERERGCREGAERVQRGCSEGAARAADLLVVDELERGHRRLVGSIRRGVCLARHHLTLGILLEV